jgi:hypothetical protein
MTVAAVAVVQSDCEEDGEAEEEAKRSSHICEFPPHHLGKCYPNLRKWEPNKKIKK